jgi:hypothetical protein
MFNTPEIYLQAELQYHREQIRSQFAGRRIQHRGTPIRAHRHSHWLVRRNATATPSSR